MYCHRCVFCIDTPARHTSGGHSNPDTVLLRWVYWHRQGDCQGESQSLLLVARHILMCSSQVLLRNNAKVYIAGRSKTKADLVIRELKEATGNEPLFHELDLASIAAVRQSAKEFLTYVFHTRYLSFRVWSIHSLQERAGAAYLVQQCVCSLSPKIYSRL